MQIQFVVCLAFLVFFFFLFSAQLSITEPLL